MKGQGKRLSGDGRPKDRRLYPPARPGGEGLECLLCLVPEEMSEQAPAPMPPDYETALAELEQLIGRIESGQLPLEQLLAGYERGAELLNFCRGKLESVENQIKVLDDGKLKPWTQE